MNTSDMDLNAILCQVRKDLKLAGEEQRSWTHHCLTEPLFIADDIVSTDLKPNT